MKKGIIISIIIIVLVMLVGYFFLINNKISNTNSNINNLTSSSASDQAILNNLKPEIINYCNLLENKAQNFSNQSGHYRPGHCFTCSHLVTEYNYEPRNDISNIRGSVYEIDSNSKGFFIKINIPLVYYWRNDRPGNIVAEFTLNKEGNITEKNIPSPPKCDEEY